MPLRSLFAAGLLIVLTACAAPVPDPSPTLTQASTPNPTVTPESISLTGTIAYSHEGDIYTMNPAKPLGITRLTNDPAQDFDPTWSPDGTQIAFRSHRDGNEEVYVMNADGSEQRNLTQHRAGDYSPAWSPDGEWIAFMSSRDGGHPNVWVMRPDGSEVRQVTTLPGISEYPTWSPDSQRIAFHCTMGKVLENGTGDFEICVVNADGSEVIQLTDADGESKLPGWSPDGSLIAFQSNRHGWPTLPDYTPPAYESSRFGEFDIYVMAADGSGQTNLTNHPREDDTDPAWSPSGDLLFTRYGCLIAMNDDGSALTPISRAGCTGLDSGHFPDWWQQR